MHWGLLTQGALAVYTDVGGSFGSDNGFLSQKAVVDVSDSDDATVKQSGESICCHSMYSSIRNRLWFVVSKISTLLCVFELFEGLSVNNESPLILQDSVISADGGDNDIQTDQAGK